MIQRTKANLIRDNVIMPSLELTGLHSYSAEDLLYKTGIIESNYEHVRQVGGPALSWWQVEPATHDDIWKNFLRYRPEFADKVMRVTDNPIAEEMVKNPWYACVIARLVYLRVPEPLPKVCSRMAQAEYYKKYYNTYRGKSTVEKTLERWAEWGE